MLKILFFAMVAAFISIIPWLIGIRKCKKAREECKGSITGLIISFILSFIYMLVFFYCSCKAQTLLTTIMYMWPTLIIGLGVLILVDNKYQSDHHVNVFRPEPFGVMLGISISILIASGIIAPVQKLIYVHDTEDGDTSYMISASKVLDEADVNTGSGYYIGAPKKRDIGGKNVAVYQICNNSIFNNLSEYIPGFILKEKNQKAQFIPKRIYFDPSYFNTKDALRTVRRKYSNIYIVGEGKFDVDDEYNPYWIYPYREKSFFSNGKDYGIIILDMKEGTVEKYPAHESDKIPQWVDFKTTVPK